MTSSTWSRKYLTGHIHHPSTHYTDLHHVHIGLSNDKALLHANSKYLVVPLSGAGSQIGYHPISETGRLPTNLPTIICGSSLVDIALNPFDTSLIASATEDGRINIWRIIDKADENEIASEWVQAFYDDSTDRLSFILYHPTVKDLLVAVSMDSFRIWDVSKKQEDLLPSIKSDSTLSDDHLSSFLVSKFPIGDGVGTFSASFNDAGDRIAIASKDKKLRVYELRKGHLLYECNAHESSRTVKVIWLYDNVICTVGFGRGAQREVIVYKDDHQVSRLGIDIAPGILFPFYDQDTGILLLAAKGDRSIFALEISQIDGKVSILKLPTFECGSLQNGFVTLPKKLVNVKEVEVIRGFRLTANNTIESIGFTIPRNRKEYFQDDIFIPTKDTETPTLSMEEWLKGADPKPLKRILIPSFGMETLSIAPPIVSNRSHAKNLNKEKSEEERKQETMEKMFAAAQLTQVRENEDPFKIKKANIGVVNDDEW